MNAANERTPGDAALRRQLLALAPPETDLWPGIAAELARQPARPRWSARRRLCAVLLAAVLLAALLMGAAVLRRWVVYDTAAGTLTILPEGEGYAPEGTGEDGNPYAAFAPVPSWQTDAAGDGSLILPETGRTRLLNSACFGQATVEVQGDAGSLSFGGGPAMLQSSDRAELLAAWPWDDGVRRMADALPERCAFTAGTVLPYTTPQQLAQAGLARLEQGDGWAAAVFDLPEEVKRQGRTLSLTYTGPDGAQVRLKSGLSSDCSLLLTGSEDLQPQPLELDGFVGGTRVTRKNADGRDETTVYLWRPIDPVMLDSSADVLLRRAAEAAGAGPDTLLGQAAALAKPGAEEEQRYLSYTITAAGLTDAELDALLVALAG